MHPAPPRRRLPWILLALAGVILTLLAIPAVMVVRIATAVPGTNPDAPRQVHELIARYQPAAANPQPGEVNGYELAQEVVAHAIALRAAPYAAMQEAIEASPTLSLSIRPDRVQLDPEHLYRPPHAVLQYEPEDELHDLQTEIASVSRVGARQWLESCEGEGIFERLDELARAPYAERTRASGLVWGAFSPATGDARSLTALCIARMHLAAERGDADETARAFEHAVALAWVYAHQPTLIERLVGESMAAFSMRNAREVAASGRLPPAALRAMAATLDRRLPLPPAELAINGERLAILDLIQRTHSDDGRGSGFALPLSFAIVDPARAPPTGTSSPSIRNATGLIMPRKRDTVALVNIAFDGMVTLAASPRRHRDLALAADIDRRVNRHRLVSILIPNVGSFIATMDAGEARLAGTRTLLAIERHRAEHHAPPATLDALVPEYLPSLPEDPFAPDARLRYRVLDTPDEHARTYLLYSVGSDGQDNGGAPAEDDPEDAINGKADGADFVFNHVAPI